MTQATNDSEQADKARRSRRAIEFGPLLKGSTKRRTWVFKNPYWYKGAWRTRGRNRLTGEQKSFTIAGVPATVHGSIAEARDEAHKAALEQLSSPSPPEPTKGPEPRGMVKNPTLKEAVDQYLETRKAEVAIGDLREASYNDYRKSLRFLQAELEKPTPQKDGKGEQPGIKTTREIEYRHIEAILTTKTAKDRLWGARSRQKALFLLRHFLGWCRKQGYTEGNPAKDFDGGKKWSAMVRKEKKRVGIALTEEQARKLLEKCRAPYSRRVWCDEGSRAGKSWKVEFEPAGDLYLAVLIALRSGLRLKNVLGLRVEHLKNECSEIDIPGEEMKNGERLSVPVHPELQVALKARLREMTAKGHRAPTGGQRFIEASWIRKAFNHAAKRAGLEHVNGAHLRFHDTRHSFASWLAHRAPRVCEQVLLGHSVSDVTGRYEHTSMDELRAAIETLPWLNPPTAEAQSPTRAQGAQEAVS